ncbi:MAG TPA: ABC transporter permease [Candidatus Dormibacteraeota bacterium]|nr:ABC transporter permease [Candidatus Dormibacteraeota bacterium]
MSSRTLSGHPLYHLTKIRFLEFWREPEAVFWTLFFPILLAAGLGIAFRNRAPDVIKVAVVDRGALSQQIARDISANPSVSAMVFEESAAAAALRTGKVALLVLPGPAKEVTYRFDDTNPDGRAARASVDDALQRAAGRVEPLQAADQHIAEPGSRYIDFLLPALLAMNVMGNGIWGVCFPIIDARRKKLLKRMVASPMSRAQYLLSFLLSRLIFLVFDITILVGFGHWAFGVPVRGSIGAIALICVVAAVSFSSIGLLVSARFSTTEAASGVANAVMLPMWIMSGVFFSARRFPDIIQPIIHALPLTAAVNALRAVMLEGATVVSQRGELEVLCAWLVLCFVIALKIFRWR